MSSKADLQIKVMELLEQLNSESRATMRGDLIAMQLNLVIDEFKKAQGEPITSFCPEH